MLSSFGRCALIDGSEPLTDDLRLGTDQSVYVPGEPIDVTVANTGPRRLFLENCCGALIVSVERQEDNAWVVERPAVCETLCLSIPLELRPGETRSAPDYLALLTPGRYRLTLRFWFYRDGELVETSSPVFTVE